jgi:hypothetical protein
MGIFYEKLINLVKDEEEGKDQKEKKKTGTPHD